jgi:hypothetical protein
MRCTLYYNLTPEDRAAHSKWVRVVAAFYGCAALLLLLAAITLPGPSSVQPRGSAVVADGRKPIRRGRSAWLFRFRRAAPTTSSAAHWRTS